MNPLLYLKDVEPLRVGEEPALPAWWKHGLPPELSDFYARFSSAAGWIGKSWIDLFSCAKLRGYNSRPELDGFFEEYLFFATNGGGEEFGVTRNENNEFIYVTIPAVDIDRASIVKMGLFVDFIKKLEEGSYLDVLASKSGGST